MKSAMMGLSTKKSNIEAVQVPEVLLSKEERSSICRWVEGTVADSPSILDLIERLAAEGPQLPHDILTSIVDFRQKGSRIRALIIRGFDDDLDQLAPTPTEQSSGNESTIEEWDPYFIRVCSSVGDIFTFSSIHNGNLLSDVMPLRSDARSKISSNYEIPFALHTDDAFTTKAGRFLAIRSLRNPHKVPTFLAIPDWSLFSEEQISLLREPVYNFMPNMAHEIEQVVLPPLPVVWGAKSDPCFRVNMNLDPTRSLSEAHKAAYEDFCSVLEQSSKPIILDQGDILLINNFKAAHGRKAYSPVLDGTDRWMKRAYVRDFLVDGLSSNGRVCGF